MLAFEIEHLERGGALAADLLAVDDALAQYGGDLVGELDLLGVHADEIAGRHQTWQREVFDVDEIERIRLGDDPFGHHVRGNRHIFDGDPEVLFDLLGDVGGLVHGGAEIAQRHRTLPHARPESQ